MSSRKKKAQSRGKRIYLEDESDYDYDEYYEQDILFSKSAPTFYSNSLSQFNCSPHKQKIVLKPRNENQRRYIELLNNPDKSIIIATGSAGTGKTFVANSYGIEKLQDDEYKKIVLTRPMVSVQDKNFGALPGDIQAKMHPWLLPIYDVLHKYVSPTELQKLIAKGSIEICSLLHMRGRSFDDAFIVADEMQNSTPQEMLMLLTRIGSNSKLVINGDPMQFDRGYDNNGLTDLLSRMQRFPSNELDVVHFTDEDVERNPVIKHILKMYKH